MDRKSYWLYTNDPFDNRKRREAFETYRFEKRLEILAGGQHGTLFLPRALGSPYFFAYCEVERLLGRHLLSR